MPLYLPSRHRAIKPSSHWAMYHRTITAYQWAFVPSYHLAIVPLSHVPRANVPSNCHHPSYHRAMYHCVIALYHCVIEPLYHQAIVPLCNCIIEPWTTIQRRFLACRRSKGLRSKLIVVSSSLFVGFCCRHRVGSPSLRRGLSLLLLLFIVAVVSRCCCRCLSSLLSPVSIWLLCLSAVPHFDAPNQSTDSLSLYEWYTPPTQSYVQGVLGGVLRRGGESCWGGRRLITLWRGHKVSIASSWRGKNG
jgi:hypothetical protein